MTDDLAQLRRRHDALAAAADGRAPRDPGGAAILVGAVVNRGSMPTAVPAMFAVQATGLAVREIEGATPTLGGGAVVPVLVLGPRVPRVGDLVRARQAAGLWVAGTGATKAGPPPAQIAGCACTAIPTTLRMASAAPSCAGGLFQPCTLEYGPTPAAYTALNLGADTFLSTASFFDGAGQSFRYYLNCQFTQFTLSRVYAESTYGTPYLDVVRYSWSLLDPANTCAPLSLTVGRIYLGGDSTCSVSITA